MLLAGPAMAQLPNPDFFPIGVFSQPSYLFSTWKSRGVNSLFQYEPQKNSLGVPTVSMADWSAAAAAQGMYYARLPSANPADDLQEKYLMAWTQLDEPDLENHNPIPSLLIDKYQNLKAISPSKPVWVNFAGNHVVMDRDYTQWVKGGDWLSSDWYPYNTNPDRYQGMIGRATDKLRASSNYSKKAFAVIESSDQLLDTSSTTGAPTPDQFRGEIWEAIVHGAQGIVYFPQQIGGGFKYDATPANLQVEMTTQNARIQGLARVLNSSVNPSSVGLTASASTLESTWRVTTSGDYFFVLNRSPLPVTDADLSFAGLTQGLNALDVVGENRSEILSGTHITDSFGAFEVHIYRAALTASGSAAPAAEPVAVPEPAGLALLGLAGLLLRRRSR